MSLCLETPATPTAHVQQLGASIMAAARSFTHGCSKELHLRQQQGASMMAATRSFSVGRELQSWPCQVTLYVTYDGLACARRFVTIPLQLTGHTHTQGHTNSISYTSLRFLHRYQIALAEGMKPSICHHGQNHTKNELHTRRLQPPNWRHKHSLASAMSFISALPSYLGGLVAAETNPMP